MNNETKLLFNQIKEIIDDSFFNRKNFVIKESDNKRIYFECYTDTLETSKFKLNLSIPSYLDEYLGVYLSIKVPQFVDSGILLVLESDGSFSVQKTLDSIVETKQKNLSRTDVIKISKMYFDLFKQTFDSKEQILCSLINQDLDSKDGLDCSFSELRVDFKQSVSKNNYLFYFHKKTKTVYLNDITGTNYKSIMTGIDEISTKIYSEYLYDYNADEITWINMFINLNNNGIIFQEAILKVKTKKHKISLFEGLFNKKNKKEDFLYYYDSDFIKHRFFKKEEIRLIWKSNLDIAKYKIDFL